MAKQSNDKPTRRRTAVLLLAASLRLASGASSSSCSSLAAPAARTHLAFYPRRGGSPSSSSTAPLLARRKSSPATRSSIQTVGSRRKSSRAQDVTFEEEYDYNPQSQSDEPSLKELRAQLGPIGTLVANTIELTVTTLGSYISGGMMGYVGGGVFGMPSTLFGKEAAGSIAARFSALNSKALTSCKSWAELSAAFSGFHNFVRLCRGGEEDHWNNILGSALTGAFLSRAKGPQAMLQGGATYAGFTYFLDKFFSTEPSSRRGPSSELLYTDVPIED